MSVVEGVTITDAKLSVSVMDGVWHGAVEGTLGLAGDNVIGTVGRCRLKPVFASTEQDVLRLGSLTRCLRVILCDLTTCYSCEGASFSA